ncbi:hypothetical protein BDW66DRAFT_88354 [Aspergillus desertorum]
MGLAAPRKKTKLSHDPNNTNWSRSTSGFGHKILSSQGWTPGSFLGARNAAHADMFTVASATHIRVIVKDDTLGLGARSKRDLLDEPTGLDAFKGLLGRLNGKSDAELQADQKKRDEVKLARYAATKWQAVRFISGGLLAQEKDESKEAPTHTSKTGTKGANPANGNCQLDNETGAIDVSKVSKTSKNQQDEDDEGKNRKEKEGKQKKDMKDKKGKNEKKDKKDKEDKKDKKRKRAKQQEDSVNSLPAQEQQTSDNSLPAPSDALKERRPPGRNMIRGRHIAQKRKALMDEKSLNEVLPLLIFSNLVANGARSSW